MIEFEIKFYFSLSTDDHVKNLLLIKGECQYMCFDYRLEHLFMIQFDLWILLFFCFKLIEQIVFIFTEVTQNTICIKKCHKPYKSQIFKVLFFVWIKINKHFHTFDCWWYSLFNIFVNVWIHSFQRCWFNCFCWSYIWLWFISILDAKIIITSWMTFR